MHLNAARLLDLVLNYIYSPTVVRASLPPAYFRVIVLLCSWPRRCAAATIGPIARDIYRSISLTRDVLVFRFS